MTDGQSPPRPFGLRSVPVTTEPVGPPVALLLWAPTGGGHLAAASAVGDAVRRAFPGLEVLLVDPTGSSLLLRCLAGMYGPVIRRAPWLWGAVFSVTNNRLVVGLLRATILRLAERSSVFADRPAAGVVVSFHPLMTQTAANLAHRWGPHVRSMVVVTDLGSPHRAWAHSQVDMVVAPTHRVAQQLGDLGVMPERCQVKGLPVGRAFVDVEALFDRAALRHELDMADRFTVLLLGGAEGSGRLVAQARAVLSGCAGVHVVAVAGRNAKARRCLAGLVDRWGDRLTVMGFVDDLSYWMMAADVVATKAGPSTVSESLACGAALLITGHLPGQERGVPELLSDTGAAWHTPSPRRLAEAVRFLVAHPDRLKRMRLAAVTTSGGPGAAVSTARLVAGMAQATPWSRAVGPEIVAAPFIQTARLGVAAKASTTQDVPLAQPGSGSGREDAVGTGREEVDKYTDDESAAR